MVDKYGDRFKKGIVICSSCHYVDNVDRPVSTCPDCGLANLGTWESMDKFRLFVEQCKPTMLNIQNPELNQIYNDMMGVV